MQYFLSWSISTATCGGFLPIEVYSSPGSRASENASSSKDQPDAAVEVLSILFETGLSKVRQVSILTSISADRKILESFFQECLQYVE